MEEETGVSPSVASSFYVLYFEGLLASQTQAARYLGGAPIPASAGCDVRYVGARHRNCAALIEPETLHLGHNNRETVLWPFEGYAWPTRLWLFLQAWLLHAKITLDGYTNHPWYAVDWRYINCAQEADVQLHRERYQSLPPDEKDVILWGSSRGAATTFCAMAQYKYKRVKLVILEGCYDTLRSVSHAHLGTLLGNVTYETFSCCTRHDPYASMCASPLDMVEHFPRNIPVAFITSTCDEIVPMDATLRLAAALRTGGHKNVHVCVLKYSRHEGYATDSLLDRREYTAFIAGVEKTTFETD